MKPRFIRDIYRITGCFRSLSIQRFASLGVIVVVVGVRQMRNVTSCSNVVENKVSSKTTPKSKEMFENGYIDTMIDAVSNILSWFWSYFYSSCRCISLGITFSPALALVPIMMVCPARTLYDWWWSIFRSSICNAGPTFIKFAQVSVFIFV